jgi:hypothetical protein
MATDVRAPAVVPARVVNAGAPPNPLVAAAPAATVMTEATEVTVTVSVPALLRDCTGDRTRFTV